MVKQLLALLAAGVIAVSGCGGDGKKQDAAEKAQTPTPEEAYAKLAEARRDLETTEEKLAVTKKFLGEHPASGATARAVDAVLYYQGDALGDMEGAIAYAEEVRSGADDAAVASALDKVMIPWYGRARMMEKMVSAADRLAAAGNLGFNDHWNVIENAASAGDWTLTRTYCEKARPLANADAYKAEYPNREMSEDEIAEAARTRMGMLLVMDGWARVNEGEIDAGLADLARADELVPRSYVGTLEYDLGLYRAKALMMKGDWAAAIDRFAAEALVMRNEEALAGLRKAYAALYKDEAGFDAWAAKLHRDVARTAEDFELADYDGRRRRFSDLRADVTLLAFWFPT